MRKQQHGKHSVPKIEQIAVFQYSVTFLRESLKAWKKCRNKNDRYTTSLFRMLFLQQIKLLEKLTKRGIVTATSRRLISLARKYLARL